MPSKKAKLELQDEARRKYQAGRLSVGDYIAAVLSDPLGRRRALQSKVRVTQSGEQVYIVIPRQRRKGKTVHIAREGADPAPVE